MAHRKNGGPLTTVYNMARVENITIQAIKKVHEAALVLAESSKAPITNDALTDLIGHEFSDPHNIVRAVSILAHCNEKVFKLVRPNAHGQIRDIQILERKLPPTLTYITTGDTKHYTAKTKPLFPSDPPPEPPLVTLDQMVTSLPKWQRRELLVLSVLVKEQLKAA